jgi:hypothetical protein
VRIETLENSFANFAESFQDAVRNLQVLVTTNMARLEENMASLHQAVDQNSIDISKMQESPEKPTSDFNAHVPISLERSVPVDVEQSRLPEQPVPRSDVHGLDPVQRNLEFEQELEDEIVALNNTLLLSRTKTSTKAALLGYPSTASSSSIDYVENNRKSRGQHNLSRKAKSRRSLHS